MPILGRNLIKVEFQVQAEVPHGVTIRVSGSAPQLGYYSPASSIPMHTSPKDYPLWKSDPIFLPRNTKISYKYLRYCGGIFESWESPRRSSHSLYVSSRKSPIIKDVYNNYSAEDSPTVDDSLKRVASSEPIKAKFSEFGSCPILNTPKPLASTSTVHKKRNVILVAYRLPVIISRKDDNDWDITWDYENMYLFSEQTLSDQYSVWWCGALTYLRTNDIFRQNEQYSVSDIEKITEKLFQMHCLPIFMDSGLNNYYYNGYCKSVLSPMLHGCTMVYDDAETSFSWQKNTAETVMYQNAYRRVNNFFAQEILRYCKQLHLLDTEPIIWINGYQLFLLPRDLRLYIANMNKKGDVDTETGSTVPNVYTSASLAMSITPLSPSITPSYLGSVSTSPYSPLDEPSTETHVSEEDAESTKSMFSPGPTFVDNLEDDVEDERLMKLYATSSQDPLVEYDGDDEEDDVLPDSDTENESATRRKPYSVKIIFFLHLPFPSYEIFRQLPLRTSILRGVLASDLIGTHTYSAARHLISSCTRHLGITQSVLQNSNISLQWGSRSVCVYISHVGLDSAVPPPLLDNYYKDEEMYYESIIAKYPGKTVIAGVDELYQTNAIRYKILGFMKLLQDFPAYRPHVVLVQVCFRQRSMAAVAEQQKLYVDQISNAARACNEQYPGSVDLVMLTGSFYSISERMALWRASKIYLNTSLSQGLNLHPQEYLVARRDAGGIVIVSEFANAHEFLNGALAVNPWDVDSIVCQLEKALEMSGSEMRQRQARDLDNITKRERRLWSNQVIQNLLDCASEDDYQTSRNPGVDLLNEDDANSITTHLSHGQLKSYYDEAERRFFILDYGGTLLAKEGFNRDLKDDFLGVLQRPPSMTMSRVLQKLCDDTRNEVWVISSSGSIVVEKTLGTFHNMGLIAVSGLKVRRPGSTVWESSTDYRKKPLPYLEETLSLCREYLFQTNGSTLYHDNYVVRFHYQYCDPDLGKQMAEKLVVELNELLRDVSVKVVHDVGVVEIRSFLGTRGAIVKTLLRQYNEKEGKDPDLIVCMGDSSVDEPMFSDVQNLYRSTTDEEEPDIVTCTVGTKPSRAQYFTTSVQENYHLLSRLTECGNKVHQS